MKLSGSIKLVTVATMTGLLGWQGMAVAQTTPSGGTTPQGARTVDPYNPNGSPLLPSPVSRAPYIPHVTPTPETIQGDPAYGAFQRGWYLTALALATRQAEAGITSSKTLLGVLYESGRGIPQDLPLAASWYELASNDGDPQAALRLGLLYLAGAGTKADKDKAAQQLEKAAAANIPEALYNLALLHQEGKVRPNDPKQIKSLLERASETGDADAMLELGIYLKDGPEEIRDPLRAAFWMGRAARRGLVPAQIYYATLLFKGDGVVPNEAEAADWFERAASKGNPIAMNRLARIYANGRGRPVDLIEASAWQFHAGRQGILDSDLEALSNSLSLEQQEQASKRAAEIGIKIGASPVLQSAQ
ncbi:tetratricopeptide repeat protein [Pseudovibrio sp. FO-BEG1]|uniref:tetratricopeptide repeat protein n=1 Tax=Pseudovibrio sp. (strain FO-BEG1) TaxID=911045 RepID=UPI0002E09DE6|nr:tetratricopeptide repeat protein [Pseudovibrio sp. FO-BEG1]